MQSWPPLLLPEKRPSTRAMTFDEWVALPEDASGELVEGILVEEEVPDPVHELIVAWLAAVFRGWIAARGGVVLGSEVKVVVSGTRGRKPDLSVILPGSPRPPRRGAIRHPPDIVVEVVTPTPRDQRRDRVEKLAEYAAFGIARFIVVDPALGSFEVFELDALGRYARAAVATEGRLEVPGLGGLVFDIDALWAEAAVAFGPESDDDGAD